MKRFILLAVLIGCSQVTEVETINQALCPDPPGDCPCGGSPIIIDTAGDGVRLTAWEDGVEFAIRPGYFKTKRSWTEPDSDDGWLVLDRDANGTIDDGLELFGNYAAQEEDEGEKRNGFVALRFLDENEDGVVDSEDVTFQYLQVWQDRNHDGVSQPAELHALSEFGITGLYTDYTEGAAYDEHGNQFKFAGLLRTTPGSSVTRIIYDIWLAGLRQLVPLPEPELLIQGNSWSSTPQTRIGYPGNGSSTLWRCNVEIIFKRSNGSFCKALQREDVPGNTASTGSTKTVACNQNACTNLSLYAGQFFGDCSTGGGSIVSPNPFKTIPDVTHPNDPATDGCSSVPNCECRCKAPTTGGGEQCEQ